MSEIISTIDQHRGNGASHHNGNGVAPRHSSSRPLRIAQLATLYESVPPKLYGGTERVVSYLTEELVRRGHDVILFASGDSKTSARLFPGWSEALRLAGLAQVANSGMGMHLSTPNSSTSFMRTLTIGVFRSPGW
jgi:hypothetical protein